MKPRTLQIRHPMRHSMPQPVQHATRLPLRPLALSLICMGMGMAPALAQTVLPSFQPGRFVTQGGVTVGTTTTATAAGGQALGISQSTLRAIIDWNSFSIGAKDAVNIQQTMGVASILLNRVTGSELSTIAGQINANGRVFLINPNGVLFGAGASVNVGGLLASTLAMSTSDPSFLEGTKSFTFERLDANAKTVSNLGAISASGGPVVLMGAGVSNAGSITADGQTVALASGRKITLDLAGDGLTNLTITPDSMATKASVANSGTLQADGGRVVLVGQSTTVGDLVVNQTGMVRARSLGVKNGEIVLGAGSDNELRVSGTLDATSSGTVAGGRIDVSGGRVRVEDATLDASGQAGGGTVRLAALTGMAVAPNATLRADGLAGNAAGGDIRIEAASYAALPGTGSEAPPATVLGLHLSGELSARGAGSGAGGKIFTSANAVEVGDDLAVSAAGGGSSGATSGATNGQWTLQSDKQIVVTSKAPAYDPGSYVNASGADASQVSAQALGNALGRSTDVVLSSNARNAEGGQQALGVVFDTAAQVVKSEGGNASLRVDSATGISMMAGSAIQSKTGALNVDFNADAFGAALPAGDAPIAVAFAAPLAPIMLTDATIETNGGNVRFYGQSDALNGRAVGYIDNDYSGVPFDSAGVQVSGGRISTCAVGATSCTQGGSISLRGLGGTLLSSSTLSGSTGVLLASTEILSGSGGITIDGVGGLTGSGVDIGRTASEGGPGARTRIASSSGDIALTGTTRGWSDGDAVARLSSRTAGAGVKVNGSDIATGGNVRIEGKGADLSALLNNEEFGKLSASSTVNASHGVMVGDASIVAGLGRRIDVEGTAGSAGVVYDFNGAPLPPAAGLDEGLTPAAVWIRASGAGQGLRVEGGQLTVNGGTGDVLLQRGTQADALLSTASNSVAGGSITVTGRNIYAGGLDGEAGTLADARGVGTGGDVRLQASVRASDGTGGMLALAAGQSVLADSASATGNGGSIRLLAQDSLRAHGTLSVRGGTAGGNGGFVETSGGNVDLTGIRVNAGAAAGTAGKAGSWLIDPFAVSIINGTGGGTLPTNPFDALANSTVQDGDINAALNGGSSVKITTGTGGAGAGAGSITMANDVLIDYTAANGALSFELDSGNSIQANGVGTTIRSSGTGGPLNVVFNAGVNPDGTPSASTGAITYNGSIDTRGGSVTMNARGDGTPTSGSVFMNGAQVQTGGGAVTLFSGQAGAPTGFVTLIDSQIDTRVGQSDAGAGGAVQIAGGNVTLSGVQLASSTGAIDIRGTSADSNSGVVITSGRGPSALSTTSGNVTVQGVARRQASSTFAGSHGVLVGGGSSITTGSGSIALRGYNFNNDPTAPAVNGDSGVRLENGARIVTTGGGNIEITGRSLNGGTGVAIEAGGSPTAPGALPVVQGSGNVVLRALNDGSTDALVIGAPVSAAGAIDLRPGGMDDSFTVFDATTTPIVLGGAGTGGFSVSGAEFARLTAPTIVAGSNTQAADITVAGALTTPGALTLQNDAGGNIAVNGPVNATQVGLLSAGNITQSAAGSITATNLLARSLKGSVDLRNAANNVATVSGSAAGSFGYVDADALTLGALSVTGFDAAGNQAAVTGVGSMAADTVFVRTLANDLTLATTVNGGSGTDLVAAARFQNPGGFGIGGGAWRIWADTWVGETRGGLAGTGTLPNLYHCAYLGLCTVTVPTGGNHFIYAQQPTATVTIDNAARPQGAPNPFFTYSVSGLILGDTGASFSGAPGTGANAGSPPGHYPIDGAFASAAGYAVKVVPGDLRVDAAPALVSVRPVLPSVDVVPGDLRVDAAPAFVFVRPVLPSVDVVRELPSTYLYDRNIGQAPICLATGPLDGDRASQSGDVLAREWSRVRSRPNLLSCVNTERRNGCADF
ncbi:filamentous hemagglutinin N-terminal domain-containing protein [Variovorax sp. H27-G14]|uniref:beta strand repeat-containing protein n=1 Tax=Variovorax sp. H27-G14 TaxID=3111914 RepID=UPI0038FC4D50